MLDTMMEPALAEALAELGQLKRHRQIERFLFAEAALMDGHEFDKWLSLWTEDGVYWAPSSASEADSVHNVSMIYDKRKDLEARISRLHGRFAFAQLPKSHLTRVVSNVEIADGDGEWVTIRSNFVLGELRRDLAHVPFGRAEHWLVPEGGAFRIKRKKASLLNSDTAMPNMVYLL